MTRPDHLDVPCPICGHTITVSILWKTEKGEFGTILSEYPMMNPDPKTIDPHDHCTCDHSKPVSEEMAKYYNDGRLQDMILSSIRPTSNSSTILEGKLWPNHPVYSGKYEVSEVWIRRVGTNHKYHIPNSVGRRAICSLLLPDPLDQEQVSDPPKEERCSLCERERLRRLERKPSPKPRRLIRRR